MMRKWNAAIEAEVEKLAEQACINAACDEHEGYDYGVMVDEAGRIEQATHAPIDGFIAGIDDRIIVSFRSGKDESLLAQFPRDDDGQPIYGDEDLRECAADGWLNISEKIMAEAKIKYELLRAGRPLSEYEQVSHEVER